MIAIYFRPDKTQVVQASIRKDLRLQVEGYDERPEALSYLLEEGAGEEARFQSFLAELKQDVDLASDDVFIVLPDYIFSYVDSVEYINDTNLAALIEEATGESVDNLYISRPIGTGSPAPERESVYAIRKKYVDRLVDASMKERIALTSVEPASLAFYRIYGVWDREMPLVEIFPQHASIVTYSPVGGVFLTDAPMLAEKNLLANPEKMSSTVTTTYAASDFAAGQMFLNLNTDMPYIVMTDKKDILDNPSVRYRFPQEAPAFPAFVISPNIEKNQQAGWMIALGTLLQGYEDLPESMQDDSPLYQSKPSFVTVRSGNLLPELARQATRNRQMKRVVQRGCKMLSGIFATCIVAELAGILYFGSFTLDPALQKDYNKAQADLAEIGTEAELISTAKEEDQKPFQAFHAITNARPDGCGFSEISIGNDAPSKDRKDEQSQKYVSLTAIAGNELIFQTFRENLARESLFQNLNISSISADNTGFRKASMTIGRGN